MLSGKVRWQQVVLFALVALVPAASLAVLGLFAVASAESSAQREVAAMIAAAADRTSRTIETTLRDAQDALAAVEDTGDPSRLEAELRRVAPPFADPIALERDGAWRFPKASTARPAARDAACDDAAARLASTAGEPREQARADLLRACTDARNAAGRFLWPLAALDALREGGTNAEPLVAWLDAHAAEMSPVERRATLLDVRDLAALPEPARARLQAILSAQRSRQEDLAAELASAEARAALEQARRSEAVISWKSATATGALRRAPSGAIVGFVVHDASLADAVAARRVDLAPDVRADVVAGAQSLKEGAAASGAGVPGASVEIAPLLFLRLLPRDPGIVARQARRSRLLLGGVGVGSTILSCLLAAFLYRRMRDVERTSDLRTDFVSTVSHELRTPIASVRMLAELLEEGRVERDEQAEVFTAIARESRRLGDTVDRLLGFSRMAAGRHRIDRRRGPVAEPVLASITAFEEQNPTGPTIRRHIDAEIEADIDAGQIRLAADNLLANAKKYAPECDSYTVTLTRAGGGVELRVADRGPGVARRDQKRIFQPFERADDRLSRATEGSGIGLSLVAHVAKAHGGRAWVESEPGKGATFCVWIEAPAASPPKDAHRADGRARPAEETP